MELSDSRINQDEADTQKFLFWFNVHNPFSNEGSIMSLSTGVIDDCTISCHSAVELGLKSMKTMIGMKVTETSLSAKYKVKPSSAVAQAVHLINAEGVKIDPSVLLQRLRFVFLSKVIE